MSPIYVGTHLPKKPNEFIILDEVDLTKDVAHLKRIIADKIKFEAENLEVIYNGLVLKNDDKLDDVLKPEVTVHCFQKTKQYEPYVPKADIANEENVRIAQGLFKIIANIQMNLNCRVAILQKILAEYPEFRRNLAALILIRDSVLFNTLHRPNVIKCVAENHPIIIEAAPFIVSTVKKELARFTSNSELATDSTNSSEEEISFSRDEAATSRNQSESARLRLISRQQLQTALAEIGFGSVNSLSNIANSEAMVGSAEGGSSSLSTSASDERISTSMLRSQLQRAFDSFEQRSSGGGGGGGSGASVGNLMNMPDPLRMDIDALEQQSLEGLGSETGSLSENGDIPTIYRTHQYAEQLRTMAQMGFLNYEANLNYLNLANGNIENAINLLMAAMS